MPIIFNSDMTVLLITLLISFLKKKPKHFINIRINK